MTTALLASMLLLAPSHVALNHTGGRWQLTVDGKPFTIKGAGGDYSKSVLASLGGNSCRTWGADNLDGLLAEAQKLGVKVTIGIWLGHKEHGFKYDEPLQVSKQFETAEAAILKYKDNPAVLMWAIGNEMEGYDQGDDPKVWAAVEQIARAAHRLDPNHPTMTVIAEIGGKKVPSINAFCPDIDIIGINSYGGVTSIYDRYVKQGGTKPYVITEFGPPGTWEAPKTEWGRPIELTSTEKAASYEKGYQANVVDHPDLCLGSYAFAWGNKQEATATWFGMFLPDGSKVGAVDAMQKAWSNKSPEHPCPQITSFKVEGKTSVAPGTVLKVRLDVSDPQGDPLTATWSLFNDGGRINTNGDAEKAPDAVPDAIETPSETGATVKMPTKPGPYRLFVVVRNAHQGAAVANIPLRVKAADTGGTGERASLPFDIYPNHGAPLPYIPSGWMGNTGAMKLDLASTDNPHSGNNCLRWDYNASDNWVGVAWQNPEGDWGDKPGGYDLSGASKLTFWARGRNGDEQVSFGFGLIKSDKKYGDTAIVDGGKVTLTPSWQKFTISLADKDLSRIKTGFVMIIAGQGKPITIYLDDIRVE
jgi:hypothetical protein